MDMLLNLLPSLLPGGIGGLLVGMIGSSRGFGNIGNILAGMIGGGVGGTAIGQSGADLGSISAILESLPAIGGIDLASKANELVGGVGGGALAAILANFRKRDN